MKKNLFLLSFLSVVLSLVSASCAKQQAELSGDNLPQKITKSISLTSELKRLITEHNRTEKQCPLREPDLLIVLTGGQMAYTRKDGVKVIPLACLKD